MHFICKCVKPKFKGKKTLSLSQYDTRVKIVTNLKIKKSFSWFEKNGEEKIKTFLSICGVSGAIVGKMKILLELEGTQKF